MAAKLTPKQRAFIDFYFACGMNATQAAKRAGYSEDSAYSIGSENLSKPEIKAALEQRYQELTMPKDEILARLTDQARGDMGDILDDSGNIDMKLARRLGKTGLIKKIRRSVTTHTDENGHGTESFTDEIEFHDPQKALLALGKFYVLFTDNITATVTHITEDAVTAELRRKVENGELTREDVLHVTDNNISLADELFRGAAQRVPAGKTQE